MLNLIYVHMNFCPTPLNLSRRYITLAWKNMETRDFLKNSKRRRSSVEMNEVTNPTGLFSNQPNQPISTNREGYERSYSDGPNPGTVYYSQAFSGHFGNFHQTASYSTKTWSIPGSGADSSSQMNQEYVEEEKWETVESRSDRRHHQSDRHHPRDDWPRNSKSYKSHYNTAHRNNKSDSSGFSSLPRRWEYTEAGMRYERDGPKTGKSGLPFSIMSYNVLSQNLLENHMYLYKFCPPETLDWDMRSEKLLAEIQLYNPDIICLQEVQSNHYESFFRNKLFKLGYGSEYIKRSGDKSDGCATFYKHTKFSLVQSTPIEYFKGDILDRDNVALILELSPNTKLYHGSVKKIGVANTHLLYNPKRGDIKLAQLMVLLAELDKILHRNSTEEKPGYFPLVLCGDFNSEPHGDLYRFLTTGYFNYEGRLARNLSGQYEGTRGRNYQMKRHFFSSSFGITDQCQYVKNVVERQENKKQTTSKQLTIQTESSSKTELFQETFPEQMASKDISCQGQNSEEVSSKYYSQDIIKSHRTHEPVPQPVPQPSGFISNLISQNNQNLQDQQAVSVSETIPVETSVESSSVLPHPDSTQSRENWDKEIQENSKTLRHFSQSSGKLWHNLKLISAYNHRIQRFGFQENEVTSQHANEPCCVDYIFYSGCRGNRQGNSSYREGKLKLLARYGLMSTDELYRMGGLPNRVHPSDHLCLISKFLLR